MSSAPKNVVGLSHQHCANGCGRFSVELHDRTKWIHETFPEHRLFSWQEKYGAFGVSVSLLDKVVAYIRKQPEHHRTVTFQEEFLALLKKHHIEYDERYLWD